MGGVRRQDLIAALATALLAVLLVSVPPLDRLRGLSIDLVTWLRWSVGGLRHDPATSPAVVVALDEATYRQRPFAGTPQVTWTREIGRVLTAVLDGGARVVGFDIIFPTSLEQSEIPFGEGTLGAHLRGFDRDYLRALALAARSGRLVLGQVQHQDQPVRPSDGQRLAVGGQANIRPLNFHTDADEVVRRIPTTFVVDGAAVPSLAVELALRAAGPGAATVAGSGPATVAGYAVPEGVPGTFTLNFEGGADDIPTYSLADLAQCASAGRREHFERAFAGRVVLFGVLLDLEDRAVTSKRLATGIEAARAPRCGDGAEPVRAGFARNSVAGVYVHATAVNNLLRRDVLVEPRPLVAAAICLGLALVVAAVALMLGPGLAGAATAGIAAAWTGGATWAAWHALLVPLADGIAAMGLTLAGVIAWRFTVADRDKRLLRRSFGLYLAPAVIDRMLASQTLPQLGGETREVTIYFSDIAQFSRIAEQLSPTELVTLMNTYLSAMTDIIERNGGFVDKYIGDAIVAVFGAPAADAQHAAAAVRAALEAEAELGRLNGAGMTAFAGLKLAHRVGLHTGPALVGNIGSRRRFNYTAMGDTTNLAARLESANKQYGTGIMASVATVAAAGEGFVWRELDRIVVVGRTGAISVFEPIGRGTAAPAQAALVEAYGIGLDCWRRRDFAGAAAAFAVHAAGDRPSALFLKRATAMAAAPPPADWQPLTVLEQK